MAVRNKKYIIRLSADERQMLGKLARSGKAAARKITRARTLLKADAGEGGPGWTDQRIAEAFDVGIRMIENVRRRCVEEGPAAAASIVPGPIVQLSGSLMGQVKHGWLPSLAVSLRLARRGGPCNSWPISWWFCR